MAAVELPQSVLDNPSTIYDWLIESRQNVGITLVGARHNAEGKNLTFKNGIIVSNNEGNIVFLLHGGHQMHFHESQIQYVMPWDNGNGNKRICDL